MSAVTGLICCAVIFAIAGFPGGGVDANKKAVEEEFARRTVSGPVARLHIVEQQQRSEQRLLAIIRTDQSTIARNQRSLETVTRAIVLHHACLERRRTEYLDGEIAWFHQIRIAEHLPVLDARREEIRVMSFDRRDAGLQPIEDEKCPLLVTTSNSK